MWVHPIRTMYYYDGEVDNGGSYGDTGYKKTAYVFCLIFLEPKTGLKKTLWATQHSIKPFP